MGALKDSLRLLSISDLHLGHLSIPPSTMCARLVDLIYPQLPDIDILVIDGDLFDSALSLAERKVIDIIAFLTSLIDECIKHDVIILCVRGTFSHDRDQIQAFYTLAQNKRMGDRCRYYDTISVDEVLGRKFLFLPDDLPYKNSDAILDDVHALLSSKGWDTVDYAFTHGYFDHVVPGGAHQPKICFRYDQFSFVKKMIISGHVHTASAITPDGKSVPMIYNGSPDRLRHGEEEAKGCFLITDSKDKPLKFQFLENKKATIFKEYTDSFSPDPLTWWKEKFESCPPKEICYFRWTHPDIGQRLAVEKLSKAYPFMVFTHRAPKEDKKPILGDKSLAISTTKTYVPTPETFSKDILDFLKASDRGDGLSTDLIDTYLKEI